MASVLVGVDEVGRGPLAGPVVAAACVVVAGEWPWARRVTDSKKLRPKVREELAALIEAHWHVAVGEASVGEIDALNIREATFVAMRRAVEKLALVGEVEVVVDGNALIKGLELPQRAVVGGDAKVLEIGAASIVAKVHRDRLMAGLAREFPHYGWEGNAGYGTAVHMEALRTFGATEHHRRSFAPVRDVLEGMPYGHAA